MSWLRNKDTGTLVGPLADDSANYMFLVGQRSVSDGRPTWEDVGDQEVGNMLSLPASRLEAFMAVVPALAVGADALETAGRASRAGVLTKAEYVPVAAINGAATNSRTFNVLDAGQAGAGSTNLATLAMVAGVNALANASLAIPPNAAPNNAVAGDDLVQFQSLHIGTGIADPGGVAVLTILYNQ